MNFKLDILHEDETLLAINKPAKLLVIPDRWNRDKPNLISIIQARYPDEKIYVVHRLDEDTSGVILFAKTAEAHRFLSQQLENRRVMKTYLAMVQGEVDHDGIIDLAIDVNPGRKGKMLIRRRGKESVTEYQVLERYRGFTWLKIVPKTGRTHQIRVHLEAIGHPLLVDPIYGGRQAVYLSELKPSYKYKPNEERRPLIDRLTLHAAEIHFTHPVSNQEIKISAELPKDMRAMLNAFRKYVSPKIST